MFDKSLNTNLAEQTMDLRVAEYKAIVQDEWKTISGFLMEDFKREFSEQYIKAVVDQHIQSHNTRVHTAMLNLVAELLGVEKKEAA